MFRIYSTVIYFYNVATCKIYKYSLGIIYKPSCHLYKKEQKQVGDKRTLCDVPINKDQYLCFVTVIKNNHATDV